ncbi:MAG: HEAT repeat domain-containing protein [Anaerolineae bacterium]|nr:HEAT repeat domain-containing protein [Anaerolineae bacterium]NUQ04536.1 HEAT repeat domain-containing protein [Anaerolineae bacterium]
MARRLIYLSERTMNGSQQVDPSIDSLVEALDSPDWDERTAASERLIAMGSMAYPLLIDQIRVGSMRRAVSAARVLAAQDHSVVYDTMTGLIASENPLLGQIAVEYVARQPHATDVLLDNLHISTYLVQISIVQALGMLGSAKALEALLHILSAPNTGSSLRLTVVSALGMLGDPRAIPHLQALLDSADEHMVKRVKRALENFAHYLDSDEGQAKSS